MNEETKRLETEDDLYKALYWRLQLFKEQLKDDDQRSKELKQTNDWYEPAHEHRQQQLAYVNSLISDFYIRQYEKNPHYRYRSRNGSVSKRQVTNWVHDDAKLLEHIPDKYIDVELKVKWGDYKKTLKITDDGKAVNKETGELVEGVTGTKGIKVIIKTPEEDKK